jgi:uncharacterized phage infection (PIP) family protein YhgE
MDAILKQETQRLKELRSFSDEASFRGSSIYEIYCMTTQNKQDQFDEAVETVKQYKRDIAVLRQAEEAYNNNNNNNNNNNSNNNDNDNDNGEGSQLSEEEEEEDEDEEEEEEDEEEKKEEEYEYGGPVTNEGINKVTDEMEDFDEH